MNKDLSETKSTFVLYKRLLSYATVYKSRLIIGILAGLLSGSSIFGLLYSSGRLIAPFESKSIQKQNINKNKSKNDKIKKLASKFNVPTIKKDGTMTWQFMLLSIISVPFFFFIRAFFLYINRYYMRWIGGRVIVDIRRDLFHNLQKQSLKFYSKSDVGHLVSKCVADTAGLEKIVSTTIADITRAPVELSAALGFIIYTSIKNDLYSVSIVLFIGIPLCILPIIILGRKIKKYTRKALERIADLVSSMHETFTCIRVVKAFHTEQFEEDRFTAENNKYFRMVIKALRSELMMSPIMEFVAILSASFFLVYCYSANVMLSDLIPVGGAAIMAYSPLKLLTKINASIQRGMAGAERIFDLVDTDTSLSEIESPIKKSSFNNEFLFKNVSFSYESNSPNILHNINLEIKKGEIIAFVGETGSGKTTIASLLARFYDPTSGNITIDGINLKEIEIASLRKIVGIVTQEAILFNNTIAYNIAYGTANPSKEAIQNAAIQANAHEFILEENEGYERVVGEKGFRLSGGQRQRICIARAILKNPPILILDEATSALDTITEQLVQEALNNLMKNRTVFAIAHRLSTITHANKICLLEKGNIVEQGTHDELYMQKGKYRKLCDMQFKQI